MRDEHLPSLIEGRQPETSVLSLVKCKISKSEYTTLMTSDDEFEIKKILKRIELGPETEVLFFIDGMGISTGFCQWYDSKRDIDDVIEDLDNIETFNPTHYKFLVNKYCEYLI
jgi:hypothetical protein